MASVNKIIILGNVGREPEYMTTKTGVGILKFSVATTEKFKDRNGDQKEDTQWHRVVLFGKLADSLKDYIEKGTQVYVEGQMKYDTYEKDGQKKTTAFINVGPKDRIQMLGGKGGARKSAPEAPLAGGDSDDDVPF